MAIGKRGKERSNQRNLIIKKSKALFREHGYQKTSVRMIAKECNFEVSNIYNYFGSKENILYQMYLDEMESALSTIQHLKDVENTSAVSDLSSLVRNHLRLVIELYKESPSFEFRKNDLTRPHRKKIIQMRDSYESILVSILNKGVKTGEFSEIDTKIVSMTVLQMINQISRWFSSKERLSLYQIEEIVLDLVLNGIKKRKEPEVGKA